MFLTKTAKKFYSYGNSAHTFVLKKISRVHGILRNYLRTHRSFRIKRYRGYSKYTVVSAVYNVERYLDDYFRSLTRQSLDFERHIHLILVDDGSTDGSAEAIKRWQKKYPENITYIYQANKGQGAARNAGLLRVKTPWVTFIDPDDFVDITYFRSVDSILKKHHGSGLEPEKAIHLLACNLIFFFDKNKTYRDSHPLKSFFSKKLNFRDIANLEDTIYLRVTTSFLSTEKIRKLGLLFTEKRWPSFEDGHFILKYLLQLDSGRMVFAQEPTYYYRKRDDGSSALDGSRNRKEYYIEQLREGYLDILQYAHKYKEKIPKFVQYTILYEMTWRLKDLQDTPPPACLTDNDVREFFFLCKEIYSYIDSELILAFPPKFSGMNFMRKTAVLHTFRNESTPFTIVYVTRFDAAKSLLQLVYYQGSPLQETIFVDGKKSLPVYAKSSRHTLCGIEFFIRRQLWIHLPPNAENFTLLLGEKPVRLSLEAKQHPPSLTCSQIRKTFVPKPPRKRRASAYDKVWILMDRDTHADDNAEHLYRHIQQNYPERNIFFALRSSSPDWERLKEDKFNLLDFGTRQYEKVLRASVKIISSHADHYVMDYYKCMLKNKDFVFLQHGVLSANLASWLNPKPISLFITSTQDEYRSIVEDGSPYDFSEKEVKLTGLPRHDKLLRASEKAEKIILVMPSWRKYLTGMTVGLSNERRFNTEFMQSQYAHSWKSFLHADRLETLTHDEGYRVMFFPHMNIQPYMELFELKEHITVSLHSDTGIQTLFTKAQIMITDYSSVAFEMALLQKPVLYYHFDHKEMFSGKHSHQIGYFDYTRHGFGPVALDEQTLLDNLEAIVRNDGQPFPEYRERMERTLAYRDGNNCERVYQCICDLDTPFSDERSLEAKQAVLPLHAELAKTR